MKTANDIDLKKLFKEFTEKVGYYSKATPEDIQTAIRAGWQNGWRPVRSVYMAGLLTDQAMASFIGGTEDRITVDPESLEATAYHLLDITRMERLKAIPRGFSEDGRLEVLCPSWPAPAVIEEIEDVTGYQVAPMLTTSRSYEACFGFIRNSVFAASRLAEDDEHNSGEDQTEKAGGDDSDDLTPADRYKLLVGGDAATAATDPVGEKISALLTRAIGADASDIHISTVQNSSGRKETRVRIRVRGALRDVDTWTDRLGKQVINRFRAAGNLSYDSNTPSDGRYDIDLGGGDRFDLRLSTMPLNVGEMLVMRLLAQEREGRSSLDEIFPPEDTDLAARIKEIIEKPDGMFLLAGRTGDGKSTTMTAAIAHVINPELKIITVEDPVEYLVPGAEQVQASHHNPFQRALRGILRLDPNIIIVGEIRDKETALMAMDAAQTGHMVISTLHVRNAASTPRRMSNVLEGASLTDLGDVLGGVLSQRLVPTLCRCADGPITDRRPVGCTRCANGWDGAVAVGEMLTVTSEINRLIASNAAPLDVREAALDQPTFTDHAAILLNQGRTSREAIRTKVGELPPLDEETGMFISKYQKNPKKPRHLNLAGGNQS